MDYTLQANQSNIKKPFRFVVLSFLFVCFLICSFLYIKSYKSIYPIINVLILFSHFVIFKGKYRVYALFLYMPFIIFFNYKPYGIGSFYSYVIIFYCAVTALEFLCSNKTLAIEDSRRIGVVAILAIYSIFISFVFSGFDGFVKSVSIFAYLSSIAFFIIDGHSLKNQSSLILLTLIGMVLANLLACLVIYVLKGEYVKNFLTNFLAPVYYRQYVSGNSSFRYPGLSSDPNYLGMNVLLLTVITLLNIRRFRFKILIGFLLGVLQIFPILGASRNYLVCLVLFLIISTFVLTIKIKKGWYLSLSIYGGLLFVFIIFGSTLLSQVLLRIISVDGRESLLDSLLSGRANLQMRYLSDYLLHPDAFIFGKGFGNSLLGGDSAHSVFVMTFRYFGIVGTVLYYFYISTFIKLRSCKKLKFFIVPIILLLIYGITIDYVAYSEMTLFLLYVYYQSFVSSPHQSTKITELEYENYSVSI